MGNFFNFCCDLFDNVILPLKNKINKKEEEPEKEFENKNRTREKIANYISTVDNEIKLCGSSSFKSFPYLQKNSIESITQFTLKCNKIHFKKKRNAGKKIKEKECYEEDISKEIVKESLKEIELGESNGKPAKFENLQEEKINFE